MIWDRWSDVPADDQAKIKNLYWIRTRVLLVYDPVVSSDQSKCPVVSTRVGQIRAHESDLFQMWQSCQAPEEQILGRCSAGTVHPISELLFRKLAN